MIELCKSAMFDTPDGEHVAGHAQMPKFVHKQLQAVTSCEVQAVLSLDYDYHSGPYLTTPVGDGFVRVIIDREEKHRVTHC